jgi:transcriptional regulator with XRE-family HTH domain
MSIAEWGSGMSGAPRNSSNNDGRASRPLHRLETVRRQQGVSLRNVARRLGIDIEHARQQEQETADLPLSVLYRWQQVLDVPLVELLVDSDSPLSPPVMERARLVKLMKTAAALHEKAASKSLRRMVQTLVDQLVEIMPELKDVAPWPSVGQRRTPDECGRTAEQLLSAEFFRRVSRGA